MIKIICVGKIKEKFYTDAINEYLKRLKKYTQIEIVEVPDTKTDNPDIALKKEAEQISKHLKEKDYIITLAIEGNQYTSLEFSNMIDKTRLVSSSIVFVIGGSCGVSEDIKQKSQRLVSFSKQTFPHQLFRVMLVEQIYRSFKIMNNESYHK